jgi:hypothetical protein
MTRPDVITAAPRNRLGRTVAATAGAAALAASLAVAAPAQAAQSTYPPGTVEVVLVSDSTSGPFSARTTETTILDGHGLTLAIETVSDLGIDGSIEDRRVVEFDYDDHGLLVLQRDLRYDGESTVPSSIVTREFVYDKKGVLLSVIDTLDAGGDGTVDETTSTTVTRASDPTRITSVLTDATGATRTDVEVLDKKGRTISRTTIYEDSQGGVQSTEEVASTYDAKGALLSVTFEATAGGAVVEVRETTFRYSAKGLLSGYTATDSSGRTTVSEVTRDDKDRETLTETTVTPSVGPAEYSREETTYDDNGATAVQRFESYSDGQLVAWYETTFVYDDRGNVTVLTTASADRRTVTESSFDKNGRTLTSTTTTFDSVGDPLSVGVYVATYDKQGRTLTTTQTFDGDADGVIDATYTSTLTFR